MPIETNCNGCGRRISVSEVFAGGTCRCPHCRALVFVPGGGSRKGVTERPEVPPGTKGATAPQRSSNSPGSQQGRTAGGESRSERMATPRSSTFRNALTLGVVVLAVALIVIAVIHYLRR